MFKRIRILFGLIIAVLIATCSIGVSFWYFGGKTFSPDITQEMMVDNIKENYSFGRTDDTNKTYTIYLFPSTVYADIYDNYLNGNSSVLPENAFGYFTVGYDDKGNKVANVDTTNVDTTSFRYTNYFSYITSNEYNNVYLSDDYERVYTFDNQGNIAVSDSNGDKLYLNGLGEPNIPTLEVFTGYDYDFNDPSEGDENRFNSKNKFRYDRFGAWDEYHSYKRSKNDDDSYSFDTSSKDLGRYLPQKLIVQQSITVDDFLNLTSQPITSMGDAHSGYGWYNLEFTSWVTFKDNKDFPYIYDQSNSNNKKLSGFMAGDITSYFDIMRNLAEYADSNNVIRLFPYFSNGKGYISNSYNNNNEYLKYGARDAIRIVTDSDNGNTKNSGEKHYFMYNTKTLNSGLISDYNAIYCTIPNLNISKDISDLIIEVSPYNTNGYGQWGGNWDQFLRLSNTDIVNNLISKYGEGLYNFYVVIADYDSIDGHRNDYYSAVYDDIVANITSENSWSELQNKRLFTLDNVTKKYMFDYTWLFRRYYCRPVAMFFEKVSESRIYKNMPSTIESDTNYTSIINDKYKDADSFIMTNESIFGLVDNNVDTSRNYSQNNPYIYIARNVDLTDRSTPIFQILFNKIYNDNIIFDLGDANSMPDQIVYNPEKNDSGGYEYNIYNVFRKAKFYFNSTSIIINNAGTKSAFGIKDNEYGMYDFILIYNSSNNSDGKDDVDVYCRRHEANFIKIFPSKESIKIDSNTGFAIHTAADGTSEIDDLLWKLDCAVGDKLTTASLGKSYKDANVDNANMSLGNFLTSYTTDVDITPEELILRDSVTKKIVAYYKNGSWVCDFDIEKNYLFYFEKLQ